MTAIASPPAAPTVTLGDADLAGGLRRIELKQLVESPWNPRKHWDPVKLAEMADSLRKGQLTPITVRPIAGKQERYEIGAGHRRFRAAPAAGLHSLLAVVREIDDVAFLELLTIENKQREDVAPLDEAAGFRLLMEKAGYDVAKLAARIGLSTKYVYDRLKLLQLIPAAKKLLEENVITAGHAILLARLSPTDQKRAIGDLEDVAESGEYAAKRESLLLRPDYAADGEELALHDRVKPVSVREFQQAIQEKIRATPERLDPFLFPESAAALEAAKEEKLSVIHITRDWRVSDDARDEKVKTFGAGSWERADGKPEEDYHTGRPTKSKTCAFSRYGFVASGPGQGEVFRVCINKQKCAIHWPDQVKAAKERAKRAKSTKPGASAKPKADPYEAQRAREQAEREREEAERARWKKALPQLRAALATVLRSAPTGPTSVLGRAVLAACRLDYDQGWAKNIMPPGRTAIDVVRRAGWITLTGDLNEYRAQSMAPLFKELGLDAPAIVEKVAPAPKPEKKPATKRAKKKGSR